MNRTYSDEEIRRRIGRWLVDDTRMTGPDWEFVVAQGIVTDFRDAVKHNGGVGEAELEETLQEIEQRGAELVKNARIYLRARAGIPARRSQGVALRQNYQPIGSQDTTPREVLLSFALAALAARDPEIQAFRANVLQGRLVIDTDRRDGWTDPAEWIERRWRAEQLADKAGGAEDHDGAELPLLQYTAYPGALVDPVEIEHPPIRTLRVAPGGALDQLRQLADRLAGQYHWDAASAVTFILTGSAPIIPALTITVDWCKQAPALTRIVLVVDPITPPHDLRVKYQEARRQIFGKELPRELDQKTMWLGVFAIENANEMSRREQMAEWNRRFPDWTYDDVERFGADRLAAERRLLRKDYGRLATTHSRFQGERS